MDNSPFVKEILLNAPPSRVWKAITDKDQMKQWYFDLDEFKPEIGFEFRFYGGKDECHQYLHICEITEVIPEKKLTYSWRYDGDPGLSHVTWELIPEGDSTKLILTHSGIETFAQDNPDLAKENFEQGWNHILGKSLKEFVESN